MQLSAEHAFGSKLPTADEITYLAGDFWQRLFEGQDQLYGLSVAVQQEYRQTVRELHEVAAAGGFETVPQYHTETYWPLLVLPEDVKPSPIRYGDGYVYGGTDGRLIYYGDTVDDSWDVPMPSTLVSAAGVTDAVVGGKLWLSEGYDATFHPTPDRHLKLRVNPLTSFEKVRDRDGKERLRLWLYMAQFEQMTMAQRFGILLSKYQKSTNEFMAAVRSVLRAQISGGTELHLREFLAALVDEKTGQLGEKVVTVLDDKTHPVVITTLRSVRGSAGSTPVVQVGDLLDDGDLLFDTVRFTDFRDGAPVWLEEMVFPRSLTGVPDKTVAAGSLPLSIEARDDDTQYLAFDADLAFWDWLDGDGDFITSVLEKWGLPAAIKDTVTASQLPSELDVLDHLAKLRLRHMLSLSQIRADALKPHAVPLLNLVREVVPPWLCHLLQLDPIATATTDYGCSPRVQLLP